MENQNSNAAAKVAQTAADGPRCHRRLVLGPAHAIGKWRYEEDCKKRPNYHDGTQRKTWEELGDVKQWSWYRNPPENTKATHEGGKDYENQN